MDRLLRTLASRSLRRGMAGEPIWLAVAAAASGWSVGPGRAGTRGDLERAASPRVSAWSSPPPTPPPPAGRPAGSDAVRRPGPRGPLPPASVSCLSTPRQRRYLLTLQPGATFHTHCGDRRPRRRHRSAPKGRRWPASTGRRFLVVRPTLADVVLKMPRGAQVIYPKDLGAILMAADIGPGMRVLEAGVGSGALSMALLRAGADVVGYELRPDFAAGARANVAAWAGPRCPTGWRSATSTRASTSVDLDRVVLDLPEPWRVLAHAEKALRPGGILLAYLPSINQVATLRAAMDAQRFGMAETSEVLRRTWHVEERSVRPDHRMVGHTGFLTTARLLVPARGGSGQCCLDESALLDEDALPGTLLGRLGDGVLEVLGHEGHAGGPARVVLHLVAVLDIGEAVVEQREHGRRDLLAQSVTGAQILVDPDLHDVSSCLSCRSDDATGR